MIEILIFAAISFYIFFRLWSVLGEREGFEQPQEDDSVTLSKKDVRDMNKLSDLEKMERLDPTFSVESFLDGAEKAFKLIVQAYTIDKNTEVLEALIQPDLCDKFKRKMQTALPIYIQNLESGLDDAQLDQDTARLTVWFKSQQGEDWIIDRWVFEKKMDDTIWRVCDVLK
jgi:hypothetical protein